MSKIIKKSRSLERFEKLQKIGVVIEAYLEPALQLHFYIYGTGSNMNLYSVSTSVQFLAYKVDPNNAVAVIVWYPERETEDETIVLKNSLKSYWEERISGVVILRPLASLA